MNDLLSRRDFIKLGALSLGAALMAGKSQPVNAASLCQDAGLSKGYYLLQGIRVYNVSKFGAISTRGEANDICDVLLKHPVSGIEYGPIYFHSVDIAACVSVAKVFKNRGIDLWLTSAALQKNVPAFNNDVFPEEYRAYSMTPEGKIVPALTRSLNTTEEVPAFDSLNPLAMNWFIRKYKARYLEPMAPYTTGYFFNEDSLFYGNAPGPNNKRIDYWDLPAYSNAALDLWKKYCVENHVTYGGKVVAKFPVHLKTMVAKGGGKTQYFPGYKVPESVEAGTQLTSIPRNTGVWAAWDNFVTSQYAESWIGRISKAVYEVNSGNPNFKGVAYFGLFHWSLGYEEVTDPNFIIGQNQMPWGTQRGVQLGKIAALPYVDHIICETYPVVWANLYEFASTYKQIAESAQKTFGLMVHRDDSSGLDETDTEEDRWKMIRNFQPTIVARYPIARLFPKDPYFNREKEALFDQRLLEYRNS